MTAKLNTHMQIRIFTVPLTETEIFDNNYLQRNCKTIFQGNIQRKYSKEKARQKLLSQYK